MGIQLQIGARAAVSGVPNGLVAHRLDRVVTDDRGDVRVQKDRRGRIRIDRVVLQPTSATGVLASDVTHGPVRRALSATSRRRTGPRGVAPEALGVTLATAGLVVLHAEVTLAADGLRAKPWNRWERTEAGAKWAATYDDAAETSDVGRYAVGQADQLQGGTAQDWAAQVQTAAADVERMLETAETLLMEGTAAGWSLARFADQVCGHTHALDTSSPLAPLVLRHIAHLADVDVDVTTAEGRAEVFAAADLGVDALASWVACSGVPPGDGPAADLLRVGEQHGMPVTIPRVALQTGQAVGPPPEGRQWIFAVENEGPLTEAHRLGVEVPVVWHGSTAALQLLQSAVAAGWKVAVSADFEPGGLRRAVWLLDRLGEAAVPWRLTTADYKVAVAKGAGVADLPASVSVPEQFAALQPLMSSSGQRVTEESRLDVLLDDMRHDTPGGVS